jgi:hypothetical protein
MGQTGEARYSTRLIFVSSCHQTFESAYLARVANVAQLVEQLIRNEQVVGSNPSIGSI